MRQLPHGYTNRTVGDDRVVVKSYQGPDPRSRFDREVAALRLTAGRLPVPPVLDAAGSVLTMGFVNGVHGQDLIDTGHADRVLRACGQLLNRIHALDLVHGDYGPNNLLIDPATWQVTAILDWEWAGIGEPVDDLAWCEWIVRMHHASHSQHLGSFFEAYDGDVPPWPARQQVMVSRCRWLRDICARWEPDGPTVALWEHRATLTAGWGPTLGVR